jgi:leader peptidase (prepilin peptidase) / N-methyltransferase
MDPDAFDIQRIEVDGSMSVWVPVTPAGTSDPAVSGRGSLAGESQTGDGCDQVSTADEETPPRSWRVRPAGVALGGVLAFVALLRVGVAPDGLLAAGVLAVLGVLAVVDLEFRLLPNRILFPALAAVIAWQVAFLPERLAEAGLAAVGAAAFLLLPSLFRRGAMGMGDVKLAALLGAVLGAPVAIALAVGSLAAWPVALVLVIRGASVRGATIPFGPFLAFGAAVVLLG